LVVDIQENAKTEEGRGSKGRFGGVERRASASIKSSKQERNQGKGSIGLEARRGSTR